MKIILNDEYIWNKNFKGFLFFLPIMFKNS